MWFRTDKIKSAARHSAWRDGNNPFSRVNSRSDRTLINDTGDLEQGAGQQRRNSTHSDNCRDDIQNDNTAEKPEPGVKHANTMPTESEPASASTTHPPVSTFKKPEENEKVGGSSEKTLTDADVASDGGPAEVNTDRPALASGISFRAFGKRKRGDAEKQRQQEEEDRSKSKLRKHIPPVQQVRAVLFPQWITINWLLLLVPVGIAVNYVDSVPAIAVFIINFLAIVPLAGILSYATEEIALRVGETLGGLLNASFG